MKRYLLRISYDGSNFAGWQSQKEGRTVQQTIEKALSSIAGKPITIVGSGRTDAGVHAFRQYAHFDFSMNMNTTQIKAALQTKLPFDILITGVYEVKDDFHARYDAVKRTYKYYLAKERTPFNRFYKSFIPRKKLFQGKIDCCLPYFIGLHDFTSFAKYNPDIKNQDCEIYEFSCEEREDDHLFTITANRFLHNMVRRIIGTIVEISHSDADPEIIQELILNRNPSQKLVTTAPPQGLYLAEVLYKPEWFE
ncbi:MAG: tRNA pseudouridine(38-40) synthase TruA [Candidatus Cloacimonetes bacterium]|nr:tRNA pseudouridine(38-40) synthase TruA [Candidatus Cloacimonadota bacterium]